MMQSMGAILILFLSTLSLRRATEIPYQRQIDQKSISIHALLAESDDFAGSAWVPEFPISIHALLAESDETSSR